MEIGEKKTIKVPPEEAMGPKMDELIMNIKRSKFPDNIIPAVGKKIKVKQEAFALYRFQPSYIS